MSEFLFYALASFFVICFLMGFIAFIIIAIELTKWVVKCVVKED